MSVGPSARHYEMLCVFSDFLSVNLNLNKTRQFRIIQLSLCDAPRQIAPNAMLLAWKAGTSVFFSCRLARRALAFLGCARGVGAGGADPFLAGGTPAGVAHTAGLERGRDALVYRERLDRAGQRRGL